MLEKLKSAIKEFGPISGSLYMIDRLLLRVSAHSRILVYELMEQPIPEGPYSTMHALSAFEQRRIEPQDKEVESMPVPESVVRSRFAQGAICLGTFKKGELIGYIWFAYRQYDEDEVRVTYEVAPSHESVFDFDLFIFPQHRLGLAFLAIWQNAANYLRAQGVRRSFSRVSRFNLATRRAHAHFGWKRVGRAVFLKLWRLELMTSTLYPYFYLSLSRRPRIRLRPATDPQSASQ